jgi:hypothetical protein
LDTGTAKHALAATKPRTRFGGLSGT